jgi:inorganic pyrophosphatase
VQSEAQLSENGRKVNWLTDQFPRRGASTTATRALFVLWIASLAQTGCSHPLPADEHDRASTRFVDGYPAFPNGTATEGLIHFVVEIPAGTNDKWEVDKSTGGLHWEQKDGRPRVVQYLAYPGNYGMIPSTSLPYERGGDGDPLDVLLLGPAVERGSVVFARPIGVLRLLDNGERDDKIIAVQAEGPLSDVHDLASLDAKYHGVRTIIETWFANYKGPGRIESGGFGDAAQALSIVLEASRYFDER